MIYAHIRHVKITVVLDCLGYISVKIIWLTVSNQSGFSLSFFFAQEGTVIHNIERNGDFTHLRSEVGCSYGGTRWPLVTNYQVITPARLMSEVSVITPRQKTCCRRSHREIFNSPSFWNLIVKFCSTSRGKQKWPFVACCVWRVGPASYGAQVVLNARR